MFSILGLTNWKTGCCKTRSELNYFNAYLLFDGGFCIIGTSVMKELSLKPLIRNNKRNECCKSSVSKRRIF